MNIITLSVSKGQFSQRLFLIFVYTNCFLWLHFVGLYDKIFMACAELEPPQVCRSLPRTGIINLQSQAYWYGRINIRPKVLAIRSNVMLDILLAKEDAAKYLTGCILITKTVRLPTEYMGTLKPGLCTSAKTIWRISCLIWTGWGWLVRKHQSWHCHWDFVLQVTMTRKSFLNISDVLTCCNLCDRGRPQIPLPWSWYHSRNHNHQHREKQWDLLINISHRQRSRRRSRLCSTKVIQVVPEEAAETETTAT